jgi:hypothetical protein
MTSFRPHLLRAAVATAVVLAPCSSHAAGLDIHANADAADIGVPIYPGAIKKAEKRDENSGFSFGIWGESFGFNLAVVSYRSSDGIDAVSDFYRDALGKYGAVLDCSQNKPRADGDRTPPDPAKKKADKDKPLTCEDDAPDAGGRLYKVGTNAQQRIFKAKPLRDGVSFQLVRIDAHGMD